MNFIFDFIGNIFGYILWFFYTIVKNYGIALILFTIVTKGLVFPFSIRQQKSMAVNARMATKQKELQKKYGSDKQKYNEELQKLYAKEGVNPASGCLTSIFPMLIMLGIYYSVINPLQNTMHIATDAVTKAGELLKTIPGVGSMFSSYSQIEIVKHFGDLKGQLTMFNAGDLANIDFYSKGFHFLGLDLLKTPAESPFGAMLWLIPVLCFVSSVLVQYLTTKLNGNPMADQQGCMKWAMYLMPLMSVWFAYTMPAAVGFYWIISTVLGYAQTVVLYQYYNINEMSAKQEAQRIALREIEEAKVKEIPNYMQKKLAAEAQAKEKAEKKPSAQNQNKQGQQKSGPQKSGTAPSKKKGNKSGNSNYMGSSKTGAQKGGQNKGNNGQ